MLRDSMRRLGLDQAIKDADQYHADTRDRLRYVAQMTGSVRPPTARAERDQQAGPIRAAWRARPRRRMVLAASATSRWKCPKPANW